MSSFYEKVYYVVRRIPAGKVTSYGRIAEMLGAPRAARAVGYALNALSDKKDNPVYAAIPWQRVINKQGRISISNREASAQQQAELLRAEGVTVSDNLYIDMEQFLWPGLHWTDLEHLWD